MAKNRRKKVETEDEEVFPELNDRVIAFVEFYLSHWNATKAARDAGYSEKTASEQASRLLANVNVQNYIVKRLRDLTATANEVVTRLTNHARGSIELFLNDQDELDLALARKNKALALVKKIKRTRRTEQKKDAPPTIITTLELELYDAQAATIQLGRILGLFVDRVEVKDWREEARKQGYDPEQVFRELVETAKRARLAGASSSRSVGRDGASASPADAGRG